MYQGLHGLIGCLVRLPPGGLLGIGGGVCGLLPGYLLKAALLLVLGQIVHKCFAILVGILHGNLIVQLHCRPVNHGLGLAVGHEPPELEELYKGFQVLLMVGLVHTPGHGIVKIRDALAAVHLILVGLDSDTGQSRIAPYVLWLSKVSMAGGKAVFKQLYQVYLAAGLGEGVKILVVDMDVPVGVSLRQVCRYNIFVIKALGPLAAVLEHGAHGGVRVDIGVLPFQVYVLCGHEGEGRVNFHQLVVHLPEALVLGPVQDVGLGCLGIVGGNELFLHNILCLLHSGGGLHTLKLTYHLGGKVVQVLVAESLGGDTHIGFEYSRAYLCRVKLDLVAVAFDDFFWHL